MRDDDTAFACGWIDVPGKVLLDRYGEAGVESALDAVVPLPLVGVTVMRIQHGLIVVEKIQIRTLRVGGRGG
jgi:hypothetical protein